MMFLSSILLLIGILAYLVISLIRRGMELRRTNRTSEQLDHCLEPFFTSKPIGSGLGLSECHGVIRQHGGELDIQSQPGRGTRVRIELPCEHGIAAPDNKQPDIFQGTDPTSDVVAKPRILYIDDDEMVRNSTAALLQSLDFSVELASERNEGLRKLEQANFQLVFCDHGLPGMNGSDVLKEIRSRWPSLPVVIVSGWSRPIDPDHLQPDAYLEKPVMYEDLAKVLKTYLQVSSV